MSALLEHEAVAKGSLAETPFAHLVIYLYRRVSAGSLVIEAPADQISATVRITQGRPTGIRGSFPIKSLLDGLLPLCGLYDGEFSFFDRDLLGNSDGAQTGVVDPYALLRASLAHHARSDMIELVLERYKGVRLRLQPGRDLERLGLRPEDRALIEILRTGPGTVEQLAGQCPLPRSQVERLLYALIVTHMIAPHEERSPEVFKSQVEPQSGRPAFAHANEVAIAAVPAWKSLASLRPGAASTSQRPGTPVSSLRPVAQAPSSSRPGARPSNAPPTSLRPGSGSVPAPAADGDDRSARRRKVEQLLARSRCDEGLALLDELIADERDAAALHALRGHLLFEKHKVDGNGLPRSVLDALKKAFEVDPDQPRALYVRGLVYKQAGDLRRAIASFKRVLEVDPKHIEAQREVRLAKLRSS